MVRKVFELHSQGWGVRRIAKHLNESDQPCPRAQQGRPRAWAPSSVWEVLHRPLYRGEIVWNRSRKRDQWGVAKQKVRPAEEWVHIPAPELRIVPQDLAKAVDARLRETGRSYRRGTKGQLWGRPAHGVESKYLLPGLARCGVCGGGIYVKSRSHGRRRAHFYGCSSYHNRGRKVCPNGVELPMDATNRAVLEAFERAVLRPDVVEQAVAQAAAELMPVGPALDAQRTALKTKISALDAEIDRLIWAIALGKKVEPLVAAMDDRVDQRDRLRRELDALQRDRGAEQFDIARLTRELQRRIEDWQGLMTHQIPQARQIVKALLKDHLTFTPVADSTWEFTGEGTLYKLLPVQLRWRPMPNCL